ncbi:MAG TPA: hypothetical protein VK712_01830 [Verrucomicrobiae bacterium]|jgi:hypothetical protein|nr:hypothetical protein [Verrucomicrobiae bacterium]
MERLDARHESEPEALPVPFERARFLDPLEADKEQLWQELIVTLKDTDACTNEQLIPIWVDEAMPQVIRDRAMLVALGAWLPHYGEERESWTWNGLGLSTSTNITRHAEVYPGFQAQRFADWLLEASAYQQATGKEMDTWMFGEVSLYNLSIDLYELGCYSDEQLELLIASVSPNSRLVEFASDDEYFEERVASVKAGDEFPVLADGLSPFACLPFESRFRQWCLKQLALWEQHRDDDRSELPEWLRHVDDTQERALYVQIARDLRSHESLSVQYLDWNVVRPGIERYGIEMLFSSEQDGFELAHHIREADICNAVMEHLLTKRDERQTTPNPPRPLTTDQALLVDSWARHKGPEAMGAFAEVEWTATEADNADFKRRMQELAERRQREQEQNPQHIAQQQAKTRFIELVNALRA